MLIILKQTHQKMWFLIKGSQEGGNISRYTYVEIGNQRN